MVTSQTMKKQIVLVIIVTIIFSCKRQDTIKLPTLIKADYDTLIKNNLNEIGIANPVVYSINVNSDSIINLKRKRTYKEGVYSDLNYSKIQKTDSLVIFIDTNENSFHSNLYGYSDPPLPPPPPLFQDSRNDSLEIINYEREYKEMKEKLLNTHYEMIPVYVYNSSGRTQVIENPHYHGGLHLLVEAKDEDNVWKPVEYFEQFNSLCGTGHVNYSLKSGQFIVAGIKKYSGTFETKLRLKLRSSDSFFYSEEFKGSVNKNQFNTEGIIQEMKERFEYKGKSKLKEKLDNSFLR